METLKQHQQLHKKISWPDLYFAAEVNKETFEDVNITTLKCFYFDLAQEQALLEVGLKSKSRLEKRIKHIIEAQTIKVQEHVEVTHSGIRVVINRETIEEGAVFSALNMVASALDKLDGKSGVVPFSESMSFKLSDFAWLRRH